nr:hypothetical protein [Synechococcus sp. Minos11]
MSSIGNGVLADSNRAQGICKDVGANRNTSSTVGIGINTNSHSIGAATISVLA